MDFEAIVIGSGFGGAVAACRLSARWPGRVLVLERGRRWPLGGFPRSPGALAEALWSEQRSGLFDLRNYRGMDVVLAAGLGGGSLIYANVFLPPPARVFERGWPAGITAARLHPYYTVAREVLGARPVPLDDADPRRRVRRAARFEAFARAQGLPWHEAEVCVRFGEPGVQARNRYGARQTACVYCGECDLGCNLHAKNSVDLNYLHVAERHHGAEVRTEAEVRRLVPLDAAGRETPEADGRHGHAVHYRDRRSGDMRRVTARRVVLAAGALGSTELLLRARDGERTLPRLGERLGCGISGNGDFVGLVTGASEPLPPSAGPVITRWIDCGLYAAHDPERAFILQDAAWPALLAWYLEGLGPVLDPRGKLRRLRAGLARLWRRWTGRGDLLGPAGRLLAPWLEDGFATRTRVLLCMGLDRAQGRLRLDGDRLLLEWSPAPSAALYAAQEALCDAFARHAGARRARVLPTWVWPFRNNVTVHPLGGCALADDPRDGVVSGREGSRGAVFGYQGLYVVDGALAPTALGANPSATICALAEWICEEITGITADAGLGMEPGAAAACR